VQAAAAAAAAAGAVVAVLAVLGGSSGLLAGLHMIPLLGGASVPPDVNKRQ